MHQKPLPRIIAKRDKLKQTVKNPVTPASHQSEPFLVFDAEHATANRHDFLPQVSPMISLLR